MLATFYSRVQAVTDPHPRHGAPRLATWRERLSRISLMIVVGGMVWAQTEIARANSSFAARAEQVFLASRVRFQIDITNAATAWQHGRACFDWAEFASRDEQRRAIAEEGIAACHRSVALDGSVAAGHYYLALNLGQLARTKRLGALRIVAEMERALKKAIELDSHFDHAGPHRSLGLLYFEAPGWPASLGSRSKARLHLEKAVELSPQYPENHLCLLEACLRWKDKEGIARELPILQELFPRARKTFSGEEWAENWEDWDKRWTSIQASVEAKKPRGKRP